MLNTAKNTIKKAVKDQVEFVGAILTGVFAGSIFTLAYVKFWEDGDVTFADIGGMLAGTGTVGLLLLAWRTIDNWKIQNEEKEMRDSLDEFYRATSAGYFTLTKYQNALLYQDIFGSSVLDNPRTAADIKKHAPDIYDQMLNKDNAKKEELSKNCNQALNEISEAREAIRNSSKKLEIVWNEQSPIDSPITVFFESFDTINKDNGATNTERSYEDSPTQLYKKEYLSLYEHFRKRLKSNY